MTLWDELQEPIVSKLYGRILDVGCGNGDYSAKLREVPEIAEVRSLDIAPGDQRYAFGQSLWSNVQQDHFIRADARNMPQVDSKSFDCVIAWHLLECFQQQEQALRELTRVSRDLVSVSMFRVAFSYWNSKTKLFWWSVEEFEAFVRSSGLTPIQPVYIDSTGAQNWLLRVPEVKV